ncbi:MAG: hypothetical protein ACLTMP_08660 [Eggerthella lenta]
MGITDAGASHVAQANDALVERLYALFPTEDAAHRTILEASIAAGASIEAPPPGETPGRYAASRALVSLELVKRAMESALLGLVRRVSQRMPRAAAPRRGGRAAAHRRPGVAAADDGRRRRTGGDGLAERDGWSAWPAPRPKGRVRRRHPQGERQRRVIARTIDLLARKHLWSRLDDRQRRALARTWRIVIADVQAREEAERKAALGLLQPID